MRHALALLALTITACGGGAEEASPPISTAGGEAATNQNAPPPAPYVPPPVTAPIAPRGAGGTSLQAPLVACGPQDSYRRVAEHRCADGSMPLGGDPQAGASARAGNVGANASGHIIDLYRVPCPGGDVEVYVDMYGCPERQETFGP